MISRDLVAANCTMKVQVVLFVLCSCVGIEEHQSTDIDKYHCPNCQPEHGPLTCELQSFFKGTRLTFSEDLGSLGHQSPTVQ